MVSLFDSSRLHVNRRKLGRSQTPSRPSPSTGPRAGWVRGASAARIAGSLVAGLTVGCTEDVSIPIVARGRYVEIASDREEPICAGTVTFMDRFVEEGFELIGEVPPQEVFLRYEWHGPSFEPPSGGGVTSRTEDGVLIRTDLLIHEHELAHAVHQEVWPDGAAFLREGFAVLLSPDRPFGPGQWRSAADLDGVLGASSLAAVEYYDAWYLVSQIVADHGMTGLRALWHAVPYGATAAEVRAAYESLFGRPIDALLEPWVVDDADSFMDGAVIERFTCTYALCTGEAAAWDGPTFTASGPTGCEDDPAAVGPHEIPGLTGPPVWRNYVLDRDIPFESEPAPDDVRVTVYSCSFDCTQFTAYDLGLGRAPVEPWREDDRRIRVQVHSELEDLPTDEPHEIHYHRVDP